MIVQDNGAGDSFAGAGAINFTGAAFGYTFLVNTSQSKPMVGSAAAPQLDLNFTATSNGTAGNVFLYASDTGFTLASGSALLTLGGTNSGGAEPSPAAPGEAPAIPSSSSRARTSSVPSSA